MGDFFRNKRGHLMLSMDDRRHNIANTLRAAGPNAINRRGVKKVKRLIAGADPSLDASYVREGRYDAWRQYVRETREAADYDPARPPAPDFNQFTVEVRPPNPDFPTTYLPIRAHVTYQPKNPVKSTPGGCKYGNYSSGGRIFCFRNPNHHKLPEGEADENMQRTAAQINAQRDLRRLVAEGAARRGRRGAAVNTERRAPAAVDTERRAPPERRAPAVRLTQLERLVRDAGAVNYPTRTRRS